MLTNAEMDSLKAIVRSEEDLRRIAENIRGDRLPSTRVMIYEFAKAALASVPHDLMLSMNKTYNAGDAVKFAANYALRVAAEIVEEIAENNT